MSCFIFFRTDGHFSLTYISEGTITTKGNVPIFDKIYNTNFRLIYSIQAYFYKEEIYFLVTVMN